MSKKTSTNTAILEEEALSAKEALSKAIASQRRERKLIRDTHKSSIISEHDILEARNALIGKPGMKVMDGHLSILFMGLKRIISDVDLIIKILETDYEEDLIATKLRLHHKMLRVMFNIVKKYHRGGIK